MYQVRYFNGNNVSFHGPYTRKADAKARASLLARQIRRERKHKGFSYSRDGDTLWINHSVYATEKIAVEAYNREDWN